MLSEKRLKEKKRCEEFNDFVIKNKIDLDKREFLDLKREFSDIFKGSIKEFADKYLYKKNETIN